MSHNDTATLIHYGKVRGLTGGWKSRWKCGRVDGRVGGSTLTEGWESFYERVFIGEFL